MKPDLNLQEIFPNWLFSPMATGFPSMGSQEMISPEERIDQQALS